MADRYAYLPLVGIGIAVAWGACALAERLGARVLVGPLAVTLGVAMTVAAHREVSHWRDGVTLFGHALEAEPRDPSLRGNFGIALLRRGDVDAGVLELATAFGVRGPAAAARARVAAILQREAEAELQARRPPSAIVLLRAALAIEPEAAGLHGRLARALFLQGRYEQAFAHFERAELEDEALADLHARAAAALLRRGDEAGARLSYRAAIVAAGRAAALERSRGREGRAREIEARQRDWQAGASAPTAN
jgi:tetratricopeptide (TPR) repeat protein